MSNFLTSETSRPALKALMLISALLALALIFISTSEGLRGSDQYQYAADAETIRKQLPVRTNLFFPAKIVRNQAVTEDSNYISHNGPLIHIVANSTRRVDVYTTWIILNCLFHLITATAIYFIARSYTTVAIATVVTSLYATSPIAIWQASNLLQEMFYSALIALCLLCYYFRNNLVTIVLLPLFYFIGALSHPIFVLTGFLHGIFLIILSPIKRDYRLALCGIASLVAVITSPAINAQWFPTSFQPGIKEIIVSAVPNYSNMVYHFQVAIPEITTGLLADKLVAAVNMQFFSIANAPFFVFTNFAGFSLVFLLYACVVRRSISFYQIAPLAILFGGYIGIIVLQQNHARFQQIISPATFLVIAFVLHRIKFNVIKPLMFVVVLSLAAGTVYSLHLRNQAILQADALSELKARLDTLTNNARFVSVDIHQHGALAYVLRPNKVLAIKTKLMKQSSMTSAINLFKPDYILMKGEREDILEHEHSFITEIENQHFGNLKLYRYQSR